jgi:transposase
MANQILSMNKLHVVLRLLIELKSRRYISRTAEISRTSVDNYASIFNAHPLSLLELSRLDAYDLQLIVKPDYRTKSSLELLYEGFAGVIKELKRVGVTKQFLWNIYKTKHPDGVGYSQYCDHLSKYLKNQEISYVFDHKAGDKLMVDFAGKKLYLTDYDTGEQIPVEFFVGILPCSGLSFAMAAMSQQSPDFLGCLGACMSAMGGVPQAIVTDNLKPAVKKASKYDPELNASMADFAAHYNTVVLPTRAYKPKDKALVEGAVKILYTRVYAPLHEKVFHSLADINKAISDLVALHNALPYQKKIGSRIQQFNTLEKATLKTLPAEVFELRKYQQAKVHPNCHVVLSEDKHHYSVPYQYVGKKIDIKYTNERVEIYWNYKQIAIHERFKAQYKYSTNTAHMHPNHQYYSNWSEKFFKNESFKIGENTRLLVGQIFGQFKHPEQAFKLCQGVLQLSKKYGKDRIEEASEICIQYDIISYSKLEYLLKLDLKDFKESAETQAVIQHQNLRGQSYYK